MRTLHAPVDRVRPPVVAVDFGHASDDELELTRVEDVDQVARDDLVEASEEGLDLSLDALDDAPLDAELDVLTLVGVGDGDVGAARLELDGLLRVEEIVGDCTASAEPEPSRAHSRRSRRSRR